MIMIVLGVNVNFNNISVLTYRAGTYFDADQK
jgi:hypothetical protein